tara:strand:+ start:1026 stop:1184 length:159 start_codon:yes stop_codon:yes gene_type:complete
MNKQISKTGSNEAGTYAEYTDGSSVKFIVSLNKTFTEDKIGNVIVVDGRQGI